MPVVFRVGSLVFYFYSNEGNEPPHIHERKGKGENESVGKWWLADGSSVFAEGFTNAELRTIRSTVLTRRQELIDAWNTHFSN
jgi:hypothetical protein